MNEKDKFRRDLPYGLMLLGFTLAIVAYFYYLAKTESACEQSLAEHGEVILMFAESSEKTYSMDSGVEICTIFSTEINGNEIMTKTCAFDNVVPVGMPVYVLYSFECDNCAKIIFDSVVYYQGYRYYTKPLNSYAYEYVIKKDL